MGIPSEYATHSNGMNIVQESIYLDFQCKYMIMP